MKKVLILGAKGNLGGQLIKKFSNKSEYEVFSYDSEDLNLLESDLIIPKVLEVKPNIIINATGYNAVDKCEEIEEEFQLAYKINVKAIKYLVQAAILSKAIFVNYSSDYVFGGDLCDDSKDDEKNFLKIKEQGGFLENDSRCPINKYGLSKMLGEDEMLKLKNKDLKYYIIRTSKLFGPNSSPVSKENFFDLMLKIAVGKKEINVVSEELSCFTYTPDLAKATKDLIEGNYDYGIYHIRNNEPSIWYDAAIELFKLKQISIKINPVLSANFPPLRSWKEALEEYITKYK
jgi:dTDP-4-dehydrorhamnose reductase